MICLRHMAAYGKIKIIQDIEIHWDSLLSGSGRFWCFFGDSAFGGVFLYSLALLNSEEMGDFRGDIFGTE